MWVSRSVSASWGFVGLASDEALKGGALGDEGCVAGYGDAIFLAIRDETGDISDELGGKIAAGLRRITGGGGEGAGEEVDLSGIGLGWANAWHDGGECGWLE